MNKHRKSFFSAEININFLKQFQFKHISSKQLVVFTRQLSTLVAAGLPLVKALRTLSEQIDSRYFKNIVNKLADDIESGSNFSSALSQYPRIFPYLFVNMVKAGELGGMLDEILKRLADLLEKQQKLLAKIKSALMYPVFVVIVAFAILSVLMVFVVPTFIGMFGELGSALPAPTRILIQISNLFKYYWYWVIAAVMLLAVIYKWLIKYKQVRFFVDNCRLRLPVFGTLIQQIAVAKFSRTLGTLISSGVPILGALETVKSIVGNRVIAQAIEKVHNSIREGESVAGPLKESNVFPPLVVKMVSIGEETGQLDKLLIQIADTYEEEVDVAVSGLTSLLEPMLIVFMGIMVGFIVIAMFLPLFSLVKLIG